MIRSHALLLGAALLALPAAGSAAESGNEARLREALRTATAQLRAAEDERARLEAANAALKKEAEALRAKAAAAGGGGGSARAERVLAATSKQLAAEAEARAQLDRELAACRNREQEAATAVTAKEGERAQLADQFGGLNDRVSVCEAKNAKLYGVASELLGRLEKMGLGQSVAAREPFLGLKRVELQNLAQDYADKLLDQKLPAQPTASAAR